MAAYLPPPWTPSCSLWQDKVNSPWALQYRQMPLYPLPSPMFGETGLAHNTRQNPLPLPWTILSKIRQHTGPPPSTLDTLSMVHGPRATDRKRLGMGPAHGTQQSLSTPLWTPSRSLWRPPELASSHITDPLLIAHRAQGQVKSCSGNL
jgi:hypothetical protein